MRHERRRLHRTAAIGLSGLMFFLASCGSPGNVVEPVVTAGERLIQASKVIAPRVGTSADEVVAAFNKLKVTGLSDDAIALQAERTVQRTVWMDDAIVRFAQQRAKTAKVVHKAACGWLDILEAMAQDTPEARKQAFYDLIVQEISNQGLTESQEKIDEVWETVTAQIVSLNESGSVDVPSLSKDLACLF